MQILRAQERERRKRGQWPSKRLRSMVLGGDRLKVAPLGLCGHPAFMPGMLWAAAWALPGVMRSWPHAVMPPLRPAVSGQPCMQARYEEHKLQCYWCTLHSLRPGRLCLWGRACACAPPLLLLVVPLPPLLVVPGLDAYWLSAPLSQRPERMQRLTLKRSDYKSHHAAKKRVNFAQSAP